MKKKQHIHITYPEAVLALLQAMTELPLVDFGDAATETCMRIIQKPDASTFLVCAPTQSMLRDRWMEMTDAWGAYVAASQWGSGIMRLRNGNQLYFRTILSPEDTTCIKDIRFVEVYI